MLKIHNLFICKKYIKKDKCKQSFGQKCIYNATSSLTVSVVFVGKCMHNKNKYTNRVIKNPNDQHFVYLELNLRPLLPAPFYKKKTSPLPFIKNKQTPITIKKTKSQLSKYITN